MRQGINARGLRSDFEDYRNGRITYRELCDKIDNPGNRRAEDRIFVDMDRLNLVGGQGRDAEDVRKGGKIGWWLLIGAVGLFLVSRMGGCGTVSGFGEDLRSVSEGIRAEMAKE